MKLSRLAFVFCAALFGSGCAIDNLIDCNTICTRYHDCYDSNYDIGACRSRCQSNSSDPAFQSRVNECDACIGGRSCTGATFNCAAQCSNVVP